MEFKKKINRRSIIVGILITLLFFSLVVRIFYIQTVEATMLQGKAQQIWNSSTVIDPKRGSIMDRNGERLAYNSPAYTVVAVLSKENKNHIQDPLDAARKLAPLLGMKEESLYRLLTKDSYQIELRPGGWKVDSEIAEKIKVLNIPGIILRKEIKRFYPNNSFASYLLGFVNYDSEAVMGIEKQYDEILRGKPGQLKVKKDLKGYDLPDGEEFFEPAEDGANVILTIDKNIQQYIESALNKAEAMYHPKKVLAIVANPQTGEILGMANSPSFNPNQYWTIEDYRNTSIDYQFEPGSTFKAVVLAAAIEEGVFDPNKTFKSGKIKVPGGTINDHNKGKGWGEITFLEGVQRSSNVAFVMLGNEMGKATLYSHIQNFGFGVPTGIDLPGESKGILKDVNEIYPLDAAAMAFGQGIAVTPLQQLMAVSAIANGGNLLEPFVVKEIVDSKTGETILKNEPTIKRRVISDETALKTRHVLEQVVEFGKEKSGYIEGYHIAGKTGTSQKMEEDGSYSMDRSIASFIGFAPADNPKLIVYVIVDEPDLNIPYYGSTIAVPIFREIMQNSLRYLKLPNDSYQMNQKSNVSEFSLQDYGNYTISNAKTELVKLGLEPIVLGDGKMVLSQFPVKNSHVSVGSKVYLVTNPKDELTMPNLVGLSLRDAVEYGYILGIEVQTKGSGMIVEQSIAPGAKLKGQKLVITLEDPKEIYQSTMNQSN